jgi:hypothetical protein
MPPCRRCWEPASRTLFLKRQAFDLLAQNDLPIEAEPDDVENLFADIDADGRKGLWCFGTGHGHLLLVQAE